MGRPSSRLKSAGAPLTCLVVTAAGAYPLLLLTLGVLTPVRSRRLRRNETCPIPLTGAALSPKGVAPPGPLDLNLRSSLNDS